MCPVTGSAALAAGLTTAGGIGAAGSFGSLAAVTATVGSQVAVANTLATVFSFGGLFKAVSAIGSITSAIGGASSAAGQSQFLAQQAAFNASQARNNALISQQNATAIEDQKRIALAKVQDRTGATLSGVNPAAAANNVLADDDADSTVGRKKIDIAGAGALDLATTSNNFDQEIRRARITGGNFQAQAGLFDTQAASINPTLSAIPILLSGASRTAGILAA
jgi:hypothetical protein